MAMINLIRVPQHASGLLAYSQSSPADELTIELNEKSQSFNFETLQEGELWTADQLRLDLPVQPLLRATRSAGEIWVECLTWYQGDSTAEAFPDNPPFPWRTPEPGLDEVKAQIHTQLKLYAAELRDRYLGPISPGETAAWTLKEAEAIAHRNGQTPITQMLALEAQISGRLLESVADRVLANAEKFRALEAIIAGVRGKHDDAVDRLDTVEEVLNYPWQTGWIIAPDP
jgi:hypothetical protein